MHQFFVTLVSMLLSCCHGGITHRAVSTATYADARTGSTMILPDRRALARRVGDGVYYAGSACVSCRRMEVSYSVR